MRVQYGIDPLADVAEGDSGSGDPLPRGRRQQANEFRDRGIQLEAITCSFPKADVVRAKTTRTGLSSRKKQTFHHSGRYWDW
jgi:hypothetical protein